MKRLTLFILVLLLGAKWGTSQNITNKQFALIKYECQISDEFRKDLKPLKKFIKKAEIRTKHQKDKLQAIMVHHLYYHLKDRFQRELDIDIIPRNTFTGDVKYNDYGYPKARISKAMRIGSAPFYFKVHIKFESKTEERIKNDPKLKKAKGDIFFPHIITEVTIWNDEGIIPVAKWKNEKITYKPMQVNKRLFRGLIEEDQLPPKPELEEGETEQASLFQLYDETLSDMISSFLED